ncbi:MAG: recombinase RecA [Bryobacter sp.]
MDQFKDAFCLLSLLQKGTTSLAIDCDPRPSKQLSTGSRYLDFSTGLNGYPVGKITEIFGKESSWKTTLALHAAVEAQKLPGIVVWLDVECAFDASYARSLGVDLQRLILLRPANAEEAIDAMTISAGSATTRLIVVDSIAALITKSERENSVELTAGTTLSAVLARGLAKLLIPCQQNECTVLLLNQIRYRNGTLFGDPHVAPGGQALRHYTSLRIQTGVTGAVQDRLARWIGASSPEPRHTGAKVIKSRASHSQLPLPLYFGKDGKLETFLDLLHCAAHLELIQQRNGALYFNETKIPIPGTANASGEMERQKIQDEMAEAVCAHFEQVRGVQGAEQAILAPKPPIREMRADSSIGIQMRAAHA